jgi:hypothetical protein
VQLEHSVNLRLGSGRVCAAYLELNFSSAVDKVEHENIDDDNTNNLLIDGRMGITRLGDSKSL